MLLLSHAKYIFSFKCSEEEAWRMPLLRGLVEANEKRGNISKFLRMHQINHGNYDIRYLPLT